MVDLSGSSFIHGDEAEEVAYKHECDWLCWLCSLRSSRLDLAMGLGLGKGPTLSETSREYIYSTPRLLKPLVSHQSLSFLFILFKA
jgi:hypothetical protein